jgi:hypothetical protein
MERAVISAILGLISTIGTLMKDSFNRYQERKQAEQEVVKANLAAQKEMALAKTKAELELGIIQVKASKSWFKHLTFFLWFGPFVLTTIYPEYGVKIFENWKIMPEWYAQSCVAIMFCVWGIQVGKDYIGNIFSRAGHFFSKRQAIRYNRKLFYDVLRSTKGNLTQYEVDVYNKVLDKIEQIEKE